MTPEERDDIADLIKNTKVDDNLLNSFLAVLQVEIDLFEIATRNEPPNPGKTYDAIAEMVKTRAPHLGFIQMNLLITQAVNSVHKFTLHLGQFIATREDRTEVMRAIVNGLKKQHQSLIEGGKEALRQKLGIAAEDNKEDSFMITPADMQKWTEGKRN